MDAEVPFEQINVHEHVKRRYTIQEKRCIVKRAYSKAKNIKVTARHFHVQPNQILDWKKSFESYSIEYLISVGKNFTLPKCVGSFSV